MGLRRHNSRILLFGQKLGTALLSPLEAMLRITNVKD